MSGGPSPELLSDWAKYRDEKCPHVINPDLSRWGCDKCTVEWVHAREQAARYEEARWWAERIEPKSSIAMECARRLGLLNPLSQPADGAKPKAEADAQNHGR